MKQLVTIFGLMFLSLTVIAGEQAADQEEQLNFKLVETKVIVGAPSLIKLRFSSDNGNACSYEVVSLRMKQGKAIMFKNYEKYKTGLISMDVDKAICSNSFGPDEFEVSFPVSFRSLGSVTSLPSIVLADYRISVNEKTLGTLKMDFQKFTDDGLKFSAKFEPVRK